MPTSGSSGCAIRMSPAPSTSSPSISCPIGRISRSRRRRRRAHVEAIREKVARAFPGKEIVIGEVGWPSAGRMREGALPSPANQARVIQDVLALAKRENFKVNVIESFRCAMEAGARRHGRRPLGAARRRLRASPNSPWARRSPTIRYWRWQAAGRLRLRRSDLRCRASATGRRHKHAPIAWLAVTGECDRRRRPDRLGDRECGAGKPRPRDGIRSVALVAAALASPVVASMTAVAGTPWPRVRLGPVARGIARGTTGSPPRSGWSRS